MERLRSLFQNPDVQALLLLTALTLIFLAPAAALQGVYFYGDATDYFARLAYSAERLRAGQVALWNPYLSLGGTHAGDPAALAWYAPALVLFLILPEAIAYNYTVILHVLFAAIGMYLVARAWGQSRAGALVAAMTYGFSGFVVGHLQHLNILVGVAWLPWIFLCLEKFFQTRRVGWLALASLALGLQILGGHTQTVLYGAAAWGAYALVRLVREWRRGAHARAFRHALALGAMVLGGLGVAAIFLAPFLELLNFVARGERLSYEFATTFSLEPARLVTFVYPYWFGGNPGSVEHGAGSVIEMSAYVGIVPLALVVLAFGRRNWRVYFLAALGALALLLALGKFTPLYQIVFRLPLFGAVRAPARFLELVVFALALLAGYGMQEIQEPRAKNLRRVVFAFLLLLLGLEIAFWLMPWLGIAFSETLSRAAANPALWAAMFFTLSTGGLLIVWQRRFFSARARVALTLALVFLDLFYFGWNFRYNWVAPLDVYAAPSENARALQQENNRFNVYYWGLGETKLASYLQRGDLAEYADRSRAGLRQSLPLRFRVHSMQGYGSEPPAYAELMRRIEGRGTFDARAARWVGNYGTHLILSQSEIALPGAQRMGRSDDVNLSRLNRGVGRIYFAARAVSVRDPMDALRALEEGALRENKIALEANAIQEFLAPSGVFDLIRDEPENIRMDIETNAPTYLVLNDTFYPGWHATVDGQPAEILRANALVRAVQIPAGARRVEFMYDPPSVKIGAALSLATLILVFAVLIFDRMRRVTLD